MNIAKLLGTDFFIAHLLWLLRFFEKLHEKNQDLNDVFCSFCYTTNLFELCERLKTDSNIGAFTVKFAKFRTPILKNIPSDCFFKKSWIFIFSDGKFYFDRKELFQMSSSQALIFDRHKGRHIFTITFLHYYWMLCREKCFENMSNTFLIVLGTFVIKCEKQ